MDRRTKNVEIFKDSVELMPYFVAVMKLRIMMPSVKCLEQKMKVKLVKEPDNEYDKEAIKVEMPGIGHIGYVANSPYTVVGESYSAGRLYDKIGDTAKGTVLYVLPKGVLCVLNTEEKPHQKKEQSIF